MDYTNHRIEDFVLDERFRQWVLQQQHDTFWQAFLTKYPYKQEAVQQARQIVLAITEEYETLSSENIENIRQNIHQRINFPTPSVVRPLHRRPWGIAVSLIGILLIGFLVSWWYSRPEVMTYRTDFGEVEDIQLPDGSTVTLNAHSTLLWYNDTSERRVMLEGEAFFRVRRDQGKMFVVQVNELELEVLGTSFNVKNRRDQTQVVLRTGSVTLRHTSSGEKALMQPGDLVSVAEHTPLTRRQVDADEYTTWVDRQLLIDHTALVELATVIEDLHGYSVVFANPTLAQRRFTATTRVPLQELGTLLQLIEITFGVEVTRTEDTIVIGSQ